VVKVEQFLALGKFPYKEGVPVVAFMDSCRLKKSLILNKEWRLWNAQ
jgi:hypothetical protein